MLGNRPVARLCVRVLLRRRLNRNYEKEEGRERGGQMQLV